MALGATAIWRVRPSGSNTNGGGYDPGISGAATDYSQQNAAQATGTVGTASGTTTFTDAGGLFTAAMIGNALWIASGAGFTVGAYFITAFGSATSVTLDRSPGTGTVAHWALGGGWADFWTNPSSASFPVVAGNTVFILGSGTPNPSAYTFDYAAGTNNVNGFGGSSLGEIVFANDPGTPGYKAPPDTTGGMPTIQATNTTGLFQLSYFICKGLWIINNVNSGKVAKATANSSVLIFGCVYDQNAFASSVIQTNWAISVIGCEVFSSSGGSGQSTAGIAGDSGTKLAVFIGNNVHDTTGPGILLDAPCVCTNNIVANCSGHGISITDNSSPSTTIANNTIDGNTGDGIHIVDQNALQNSTIFNNIISNHTTAATYGIDVIAGTAAANDLIKLLVDYNSFYNNSSNYNAISAGPHDTALGVTPYVASATEDYTLV